MLMPSTVSPWSIYEMQICLWRITHYQLVCIQCTVTVISVECTSNDKNCRLDIMKMLLKRTFFPVSVIMRVLQNFIPEGESIRQSRGKV